jgi:uncharacterized protein YsxB (DUF464 family)
MKMHKNIYIFNVKKSQSISGHSMFLCKFSDILCSCASFQEKEAFFVTYLKIENMFRVKEFAFFTRDAKHVANSWWDCENWGSTMMRFVSTS